MRLPADVDILSAVMAAKSAVHLWYSCAHLLKDGSRKNSSLSLLTVRPVQQYYTTQCSYSQ